MSGNSHDRAFGNSADPMIILEIGGNHEGNFEYATKLVDLACASKANVVKLQIYSADGLVNPKFDEKRHQHFGKFELSIEQYRTLLRKIRSSGKKSCASIWSKDLYLELEDEIDVLKVGSGDLTNFLLTDLFLKSGKPVVLSTGLASLEEVTAVINRCKEILGTDWNSSIALLQCTTSYPCPAEHTHLRVIGQYMNLFDCPVGFSDHYEGSLASEVAYDMGAQVFEFHFTDSRDGKVFRDHKVSWTKDEVDKFVDRTKLVSSMMGTEVKELTSYEAGQNYQKEFRKGLYYKKSLPKGTKLTSDDLISLRPAAEIDPSRYEEVVGRILKFDSDSLDEIRIEDLETLS